MVKQTLRILTSAADQLNIELVMESYIPVGVFMHLS